MKKLFYILFLSSVVFTACNNFGKDSVGKADSANQANLDTALNNNSTVIDDGSSAFLVRAINGGMTETDITAYAQQNAVYQPVKDFAVMLFNDHTAVNNTIKGIAAQKNIVLPTAISTDKQKEINNLKGLAPKDFDKEFIRIIIRNHEAGIEMFTAALLDTKDADVRAFADKTLPALKAHLALAKELEKKYW